MYFIDILIAFLGLCDYRRLKMNTIPSLYPAILNKTDNQNEGAAKRLQRGQERASKATVKELLQATDESECSTPSPNTIETCEDELENAPINNIGTQTENITYLNDLKRKMFVFLFYFT